MQAGIGFFVIQHVLSVYLPARFSSLTVAGFAFGALTYARHPEGVLEFSKRRWTQRFEKLFFSRKDAEQGLSGSLTTSQAHG
jgi:hypothetical protein